MTGRSASCPPTSTCVSATSASRRMDASTVQRIGHCQASRTSRTGRFARAQLAQISQPVFRRAQRDHMPIASTLWMTATAKSQSPPMPCRRGSAKLLPTQRHRAGDLRAVVGGRAFDAFAAGIWRDYEHQNGAVVIGSADYVRLTGDTGVNTVSLWLQARRRLRARSKTRFATAAGDAIRLAHAARSAPPVAAGIRSDVRDHLSAGAGRRADRSVRHRGGHQRAGAGAAREFGVLRHLGFTRAQIRVLAIEGAVLGA